MKELNVFILWQSGEIHCNRLLNEIQSIFKIKKIYNIIWERKDITTNLTKVYPNRDFTLDSPKLKEVGFTNNKLRLYAIVVMDEDPLFKEGVNQKVYDFKFKDRLIYNSNPNFLHGSDNEKEAFYNLSALINIDKQAFQNLKKEKTKYCYFDEKLRIPKIKYYEEYNFKSLIELFDTLNKNVKWTILRNWEGMPDIPLIDGHGDIDILVDDYYKTVALLRGSRPEPIKHLLYRIHYHVMVDGKRTPFDIRYVGDEYYDKKWESNLLNNRLNEDGFFHLDNETYFWSLLYHGLIHKPVLKDDYITKLNCLRKKLKKCKVKKSIQKLDTKYLLKLLAKYLRKNRIKVTIPIDKSVFFNISNKDIINEYDKIFILNNFIKRIRNAILLRKNRLIYLLRKSKISRKIMDIIWCKVKDFKKKKIHIDGQHYKLFIKQVICQNKEAPRLIVVSYLPNKKTANVLKLCIETINKYTEIPYELWVIDNNSPLDNVRWLLYSENVNLVLNRTNSKEKGSYANALGLEITRRLINPETKYFMTLHQDAAVCKKGWLKNMLSKFTDEIKAVGVRKDNARVKDGILHVLGYIVDFQIFKDLNLTFYPELPEYDVGDKAIVKLKENGYKIYAFPNTIWDNNIVKKLPRDSIFKDFNVDRSINDKGDVFFLHLGRSVFKSTGEYYDKEKTIKNWVNFIEENLLSNAKI